MKVRRHVVNTRDGLGRTPLMIAAALGHAPLVKLLLDEGADVSLCTHEGHNAISLATSPQATQILLNGCCRNLRLMT